MKKGLKMLSTLTLALIMCFSFTMIKPAQVSAAGSYAGGYYEWVPVYEESLIVFYNAPGASSYCSLGELGITYAYDNRGNCNIVSAWNMGAPDGWEFCYAQISENGQRVTVRLHLKGTSIYDQVYIYGSDLY